jgi:hypothetical protein
VNGRVTQTAGLAYDSIKAALHSVRASHADTYLASPLYYALTCRRGWTIYAERQSIVVTCIHPQSVDTWLIYPEVPENASNPLLKQLLVSFQAGNRKFKLAKFSQKALSSLGSALSDSALRGASLHLVEEDAMDWRYPSHVLDTRIVASLPGIEFAKIRNKLRRIERYMTWSSLDVSRDFSALKQILARWKATRSDSRGLGDVSIDYYEHLLELLLRIPQAGSGMVFFLKQQPVGFTAWDVTSHTANVFANIADTSFTGLADFQVVTMARCLAASGIGYLNLGGSELLSLDKFKRKFKPAISLQQYSGLLQCQLFDRERHVTLERFAVLADADS